MTMGEARRRRAADTLDGGPPSDEKIALQIDVFDPLQAICACDDKIRLAAIRETASRAFRRPTPICGACDYEFGYGEPPAALFCLRPMFPKGEAFTFLSGVICRRCAGRPSDELMTALVTHLRALKPDATIIEGGTA
jgi:uncharacterized CHY-type Zn-finger protein